VGSGLGAEQVEDEVGEAVEDGRLAVEAGGGVHHAEHALPVDDAVEVAEDGGARTSWH